MDDHGATYWAYGSTLDTSWGAQRPNVSWPAGRHDFQEGVYESLERARRTCELAGFGSVAEVDNDLVEWNYGIYEGRRTAEILAECPGWQLFRDGCPGGESPAQVAARAENVLNRVRAARQHHARPAGSRHAGALFFELALADLTRAAALFRHIHDQTNGVDGWVSLEVSPLLAHDTASTLAAAQDLFARAALSNLFIKIPGTKEGLPAIEEAIFAGIPINVTLLFSREQYVAAAEAFLRGIERRIDAGLNPDVGSVASVFISRWDTAVGNKVPENLRNQLGIAIAERTYKAYRDLLNSPRWQRVYNLGAQPQRLLWASTGTKDPKASDTLYIKALAAPFTVNTMPEATLNALAEHGELGNILPANGGDCEEVLAEFAKAGIDVEALAAQLQNDGAKTFVTSWNELMHVIESKSAALRKAS